MFSVNVYAVFFCLLIASCWGKHTLHVDNVAPSATDTVLLNNVFSEVYTADNADLR